MCWKLELRWGNLSQFGSFRQLLTIWSGLSECGRRAGHTASTAAVNLESSVAALRHQAGALWNIAELDVIGTQGEDSAHFPT